MISIKDTESEQKVEIKVEEKLKPRLKIEKKEGKEGIE